MTELVAKIEFESPINRETIYSNTRIGYGKSTMDLYKHDGEHYTIEWCYLVGTGDEDSVGIGIWTRDKVVTDYDGVFELSKQAIQLLNDYGLDTSEL